jgi:hypothetical protein
MFPTRASRRPEAAQEGRDLGSSRALVDAPFPIFTGYWLPPFKERLHIVLALRDLDPQWVLGAADALGVSADPAAAPFLAPFRAALVETDESPATPPGPRATAAELRAIADAIVKDAADAMDVRANELRAVVAQVVAACAARGPRSRTCGRPWRSRRETQAGAGGTDAERAARGLPLPSSQWAASV